MIHVIKVEAPWCVSCASLQTQLTRLVEEGRITLERKDLSTPDGMDYARTNNIRSLPTMVVGNSYIHTLDQLLEILNDPTEV